MSKARQRFVSAFSAGREAFLQAQKEGKQAKAKKWDIWMYCQKVRKAIYKTLNKSIRRHWNRGWVAASEGNISNKQRKLNDRISMYQKVKSKGGA